MPKLKIGTIIPTDKEEIAINKGIEADPDTYELSGAEFSKLRSTKKDKITLRLSPKVTEYFKTTGKDWQTKIDEALLEYIDAHQE